jgi:hypothetical protein
MVNASESNHIDDRHKSGGFSRYLGRSYIVPFQTLSSNYRTYSNLDGQIDRADISRCSLPYGGISDNDGPAFAPNPATGGNWAARVMETHEGGDACDIGNPVFGLPVSSILGFDLIKAAHDGGCVVGADTPDGLNIENAGLNPTREGWWLQRDKIHFKCDPHIAAILPPRGRR